MSVAAASTDSHDGCAGTVAQTVTQGRAVLCRYCGTDGDTEERSASTAVTYMGRTGAGTHTQVT